jgi:hypothetical protein
LSKENSGNQKTLHSYGYFFVDNNMGEGVGESLGESLGECLFSLTHLFSIS